MKAGTYYVGDLCYVLHDVWREVCSLTLSKGGAAINGEFVLKDGRTFAMYQTAYGDGVYEDEETRIYPVDSGTLGCIELVSLNKDDAEEMGNIIHFDTPFNTSSDNGTIIFGSVKIDTGFPD